jgi:predicted NBD/HSP70 family sugar kinase
MSRAQLARHLSLSPTLISHLTKRLLADGLLVELDSEETSGRGRPAQLLGLDIAAGNAIGVKLGPDHITLVELGIDTTLVRLAQEPLTTGSKTYLADLVQMISDFLKGSGSRQLLGVGIGLPGNVDNQSSGVVDSHQLGFRQLGLGLLLRRSLGLPVLVENSVKALAVAERLYGLGRHHRDFAVVTVGSEIGAAFIINGMLYRGASGNAGDIGHIVVQRGGPACTCGNRGCLQAVIGQSALVDRARQEGVISQRASITALGAAADAGDTRAQEVFAEAGHVLGTTLASITQGLDPEIVLILGEATVSWQHWSFGFEPAFRADLSTSRRGVPTAVEPWQDASWAQGAAALVFATPFDTGGLSGDQGRLVRERLAGSPTSPDD